MKAMARPRCAAARERPHATNPTLADPTAKGRLAALGVEPMPMAPAAFGQFIAADTEKWAKVIRTANIKPE
jgi:tripartite-type tricarboxylate transporter receptor subunit TctC